MIIFVGKSGGQPSDIAILFQPGNSFDGTGALIKRAETTTIDSGTSGTVSTYYLHSSVTGNVLAEYDNTGLRRESNVYAGNQLIAQQLTEGTTTSFLSVFAAIFWPWFRSGFALVWHFDTLSQLMKQVKH